MSGCFSPKVSLFLALLALRLDLGILGHPTIQDASQGVMGLITSQFPTGEELLCAGKKNNMGFRWTSVMCRTLPSGFNINDKSIAMLISRQPGRESQRSRTLWPSPDYLSSLHLQPLDRIHHKNVSEIVKAQNVATSTQHPGPHTPRPCFCVFLLFLFVFLLLISLLSSSRPGGDQTWVRAQQTKHQSPLRWRVK